MQFLLFAATAALSTAVVNAVPVLEKKAILAGGPAITPIPSNCTLQTIHPAKVNGEIPTAFHATSAFSTAHSVYTMNIPTDAGQDEASLKQQCLEQCYGFGNPEECVAATWGENVTYTAYGYTSQGYSCQFFGSFLKKKDLEEVTDGSYLSATATNIRCPSPRSP